MSIRLPDIHFSRLFEGCKIERHAAGTNLFMQEDPSDRLYAIVSGRVEISIYLRSGRKLVANIETEHNLIGEIGMLDGGPRSATATCITDCELMSISRGRFLSRLTEFPDIAMFLIDLLCRRIRRLSGELGDQATLNMEARLAKRILFLNNILAGTDGWITISQADLAEYLGATRESVNKIIKEWQRERIVESRRGAVRPLAADELYAIANPVTD